MKNIYTLFVFLLLGFKASAQIITIPDANFKARLLSADVTNTIAKDSNDNSIKIDSNNDGEIQVSEALAVAKLNTYLTPFDTSFTINSIEGVQYFTNLTELRCGGPLHLTSLPVMDSLVNLEYFDCSGNELTDIHNVENLVSLKYLIVSGNHITQVNLSNLTNLLSFYCEHNLLTCIDLSGTSVYAMWCSGNPNLVNVILQNGVITSEFSKMMPTIPPPLPNLNFTNNPNLQQICYDNGEYGAVLQGFFGESTGSVNITTNCLPYDCTSLGITKPLASAVSIFPNPVTAILNISLSDSAVLKSVTVYDVLGQQLIYSKASYVDVSSLTKGTYLVTVETDKGKETKKIIKL